MRMVRLQKLVYTLLMCVALLAVTATADIVKKTAGASASESAATPQTGEQINWHVIASGGQASTSSSYSLSGTIGQTAAGTVSSSSYAIHQGFWQNFTASNGCCMGLRGNVDGIGGDAPTLGDLSSLIDALFISLNPPTCPAEANVDGIGPDTQAGITLGDLSALIDVLFISLNPPPACP